MDKVDALEVLLGEAVKNMGEIQTNLIILEKALLAKSVITYKDLEKAKAEWARTAHDLRDYNKLDRETPEETEH